MNLQTSHEHTVRVRFCVITMRTTHLGESEVLLISMDFAPLSCDIVTYCTEEVVHFDIGIDFDAAYVALGLCDEVEDFHRGHGGWC